MTDKFKEWYAETHPNLDPQEDDMYYMLYEAYKAGAVEGFIYGKFDYEHQLLNRCTSTI